MAHKPCYHVTCDFPPSKSKNLKPKKAAQLHFTQILGKSPLEVNFRKMVHFVSQIVM